jgi:hypothetical protein
MLSQLPSFSIPLSEPVLIAICIALATLLVYQIMTEPRDDWNKLPGPSRLPLVGSYEVYGYSKKLELHKFFMDSSIKYGPLVAVKIGNRYCLTNSPITLSH